MCFAVKGETGNTAIENYLRCNKRKSVLYCAVVTVGVGSNNWRKLLCSNQTWVITAQLALDLSHKGI